MKQEIAEIKQRILEAITKDINEDIRSQQIYDRVLPLIKMHDGKPNGKRFSDAAKAWLPEFRQVFVEQRVTYANLNIKWHMDNPDEHHVLHLGYKGHISLLDFQTCNSCFQESEHHRIALNRSIIDSGKLETLSEHIYNIYQAKKFISQELNHVHFPAIYSALQACDLKNTNLTY